MGLIEWLFVIIFFGLTVFLIENYRSNNSLSIKEHMICSSKIPKAFDGKTIAFFSDLHNRELGKNNEKIWKFLEKIKPDYVFVGGDMIVGKEGHSIDVAVSLLKNLSEKYPTYCGNGNHEMKLLWKADKHSQLPVIYEKYKSELEKLNLHYLSDETIQIEEGENFIYLTELDLPREYYERFSHKELLQSVIEEKIGVCRSDCFHILMTHNPAYFESYAQWGADLTLSGHVHGGIMRLPFLGGVIAPSFEIFPKYDAGLFEKDGKKMIISVGQGVHSIPIRLFNPPKIDVIRLKRIER